MKTLLKNKRLISGLLATTFGVAILVMSMSMAWFTSGGTGTTNPITLGTLEVQAGLNDLPKDFVDNNYPGTDRFEGQLGWVKKIGTLDGFVQLDLGIKVTPKLDDPEVIKAIANDEKNQTWIPNPAYRASRCDDPKCQHMEAGIYGTPCFNADGTPGHAATEPCNHNAYIVPEFIRVDLFDPKGKIEAKMIKDGRAWIDKEDNITEYSVHPLGTWVNSNTWATYVWFLGRDGRYYIEMNSTGKDVLHFAYDLDINGPATGNEFQGAKVEVELNWNAVQGRPPAAMQDVFTNAPNLGVVYTDALGTHEYYIDEGYGPVPGPVDLSQPVSSISFGGGTILVGAPYFELLPGSVMVPMFDAGVKTHDGTDPSIDPNGVTNFGVGPTFLEAVTQYVNSLPNDYWVKHVVAAAYGIDF